MIDSNTWNKIKVNINDLEHICRENNIPLCFAYYRLAYEGIISYGSKEYNEHKEKNKLGVMLLIYLFYKS